MFKEYGSFLWPKPSAGKEAMGLTFSRMLEVQKSFFRRQNLSPSSSSSCPCLLHCPTGLFQELFLGNLNTDLQLSVFPENLREGKGHDF